MNLTYAKSLALLGTALILAAPAAAAVTTFATYSALTSAPNLRFVNSGNSNDRTSDATFYSIATGTANTPGTVLVRFSFLQATLAPFATNITASYTYNASIARDTPAVIVLGQIAQQGLTGSFSFLTTTAITVGGPNLTTHTYAAGSNLLSGIFSTSTLTGSGSAASTSASTEDGATVFFTSDFLDFSNTTERDRGLTLTSISPSLSIHTGDNNALNSFRTNASGQYSSNEAPIIIGSTVPEPATWGLLMVGFVLVGAKTRRSMLRKPVVA